MFAPVGKWRIISPSLNHSRIVDDVIVKQDATRDEYMMKMIFGRNIPSLTSTGGSRIIRKVFLPVGYPESATPNYSLFVRYTFFQVSLISLTRILSTQAMLLAVGIGRSGALPMAAVINWLLKDGLGHLGSLFAGTKINTKFDSDPKRYKFLSVLLGQSANFLGIMSLSYPGLFLLLTSLSSGLSRIGTLAVTSSRARIYEDFSLQGNLGDLVRCSQAQSTLGTVVGTVIGVSLAPLIGGDVTSILAIFLPASLATHYVAFKAVSVIEMSTFNRQRFELVIEEYFNSGIVPDFHVIAKKEKFVLYFSQFKNIRVNPPISPATVSTDMIDSLVNSGYYISGGTERYVDVFFRDTVNPDQVLKGMFNACSMARGRTVNGNDFDQFITATKAAGWRTHLTFIDDIDSRVCIVSDNPLV
jgi:hypothetical protein